MATYRLMGSVIILTIDTSRLSRRTPTAIAGRSLTTPIARVRPFSFEGRLHWLIGM